MPSKSLSKVQKSVSKKKGASKGVHVNSRDAKRLQRATLRDEKVLKTQQIRARQNQPYLDRVTFFQESPIDSDVWSMDDIQQVVQSFIDSRDEEIEELSAQRRPGRPISGRESLLQQQKSDLLKERASGFWVPDMTDAKNVEDIKGWDGNWSSLSHMKFLRINDTGTITQSDFPPRKA